MTITNGYCTLAEVKAQLMELSSYTSSVLTFTASSKTIADAAYGLNQFRAADVLYITGSLSNNGYFTVATGGRGSCVVDQALANEVSGATVTITKVDKGDDAALEIAINAASRLIDNYCGRVFYSTATQTRYYTAENAATLFIDDATTITTVYTDEDGDGTYENTWAATDWLAAPYNAALEGKPYTRLEVSEDGAYSFPVDVSKGVKVLGTFGHATTTADVVKQACVIQAARVYKRGQAPFGIVGAGQPGGEARLLQPLDPDVLSLLAGVRRLV